MKIKREVAIMGLPLLAGALAGLCVAVQAYAWAIPRLESLIVPTSQVAFWQGLGRLAGVQDKLTTLATAGEIIAVVLFTLHAIEACGLFAWWRAPGLAKWARTGVLLLGAGTIIGAGTPSLVLFPVGTFYYYNRWVFSTVASNSAFLLAAGLLIVLFQPRLFPTVPARPRWLLALCLGLAFVTGCAAAAEHVSRSLYFTGDFVERLMSISLLVPPVTFIAGCTAVLAVLYGGVGLWFSVLGEGRSPLAGLVVTGIMGLGLFVGAQAVADRYVLLGTLGDHLALESGTTDPYTVTTIDGGLVTTNYHSPSRPTWRTPANIAELRTYMAQHSWRRGTQTRLQDQANTLLVEDAMLDWHPEEGLQRLSEGVQDLPPSCLLNSMFTEALVRARPASEAMRSLGRTLGDSEKFTVLGPRACMFVGAMYRHLGMSQAENAWFAQAAAGGVRPGVLASARADSDLHPMGLVEGQILVDGRPLPHAAVMLQQTEREVNLWRTLDAMNSLEGLEQAGSSGIYSIRLMGVTSTTDETGHFDCTPADYGDYTLAIRIPGPPRDFTVDAAVPSITLHSPTLNLGTIDLH